MSRLLRVARDLDFSEIQTLSARGEETTLVLGNLDQRIGVASLQVRQVVPSRLANMARACARVRPHAEIVVSDDPAVANAVFADSAVRSGVRSYAVRATDPVVVENELTKLDLSKVDQLKVTSELTRDIVTRRFGRELHVVLEQPSTSDVAPLASGPVHKLVWMGSADPSEGLLDFARIAGSSDLPAEILWSSIPSPEQFTSLIASLGLQGAVERVRFGWPGPFDAFMKRLHRDRHDSVWVFTGRSRPSRCWLECVLGSGTRVVAFDNHAVRELQALGLGALTAVPEGSVVSAVRAIADLDGAR